MSTREKKIPKGILIAIGGGVDRGTVPDEENSEDYGIKFLETGILKRLLTALTGKTDRVEIITTASQIPEQTGEHYVDAFKRLGNENIDVIHIKDRKDASNEEYLQRVREAEGVLFTGGDQMRLTRIFSKTEFLKILMRRYEDEEFVLAGTSAGAMAMSYNMISRGISTEALLKGMVNITEGLGFIKEVTFDSHFIQRGRFGRLCQAIATEPVYVGIGLGEDTGLLITNGDHMEAIGSGLVMIVEGDHIKYTNIEEVNVGEPISVENLIVHILSQGHSYILSERRLIH